MEITKTAINDIIKNVGGSDNISLLTHCVTRLRFVLRNESLIDEEALKQNELVKGCFNAKGQYQVIIGPGLVDRVYDECLKVTGAKEASKEDLKNIENESMNPLQRAIKIFADVFYPILPAIVGAGLLLGISNVLSNPGIFSEQSVIQMYPSIAGLADMINMIANTAFTYIPVLVAWSATKRFGGSPMLGILLGLVFINENLIPGSQMSSVISGAVEPQYWNVLGLQILKLGYQNSVLPAFVASFVLVKLEGWLRKRIPDTLHLIFVAPIAITITAFLTFLLIGPAMNQVATWITDAIIWLFDIAPIPAGFVFGALWAPLVVTGMHHALIAVNIQLVAATQQSFMVAIITIVCIAEAGSVFAMSRLLKTKNERSMAISAGTAAVLGVTEPSMFGVTIPAKYPFMCTVISAGIAGALMMVFGIYAVSLGPSGPLAFTIIPAQFWLPLYGCMALAFIMAFAATYTIGKSKMRKETVKAVEEKTVELKEEVVVNAPVAGQIVPLAETKDETFASGALGSGVAIIPEKNEVVSPVDGTVEMVFPSKHAIGLKTNEGVEILIHVGINTVELNGEGFSTYVKVNDKVKKGDKLLTFDQSFIESKGYDLTTFIVITNAEQNSVHINRNKGQIKESQNIFAIK